MKNAIIINSKASRVPKRKKLIKKYCKKINFKCRVYYVDNPNKLTRTYDKIIESKPNLVLIGGGDGTVISAVDYLLNRGYKGNFAILPFGTANYLARNLGMPVDYKKALRRIQNGSIKKINLAEANGQMFSLIADIGITSSVSENVRLRYKRVLGQGAYILEGFRQLFNHSSFEYDISLDNNRHIKGNAHQIVALNADLNLQLSVAPKNNIEDKDLKLAIYGENISLVRLLFYTFIYIVTFGKIKKAIDSYEFKKAIISVSPNKKFSLDGELKDLTPLELKVSKNKISFIC